MCDDLKRDFYSACPVWYWPVLWWNLLVMERYLSNLYAASGRTEMTYGLSLDARGRLRLVFLSDAARRVAQGRTMPVPPYHLSNPVRLERPTAGYLCHQDCAVEDARASQTVCSTSTSPSLYLDPG